MKMMVEEYDFHAKAHCKIPNKKFSKTKVERPALWLCRLSYQLQGEHAIGMPAPKLDVLHPIQLHPSTPGRGEKAGLSVRAPATQEGGLDGILGS